MDTENIIWLIFMIIAGVFSITGNAKKKRAGRKAPETAVPPFVPAEVSGETPRKAAAPKPKRTKKTAAPKPALQTPASTRPATPNPAPEQPLPGEIGAPETEGSTTQRPEFNLRDAVIYSEILKPKFDE